MMESKLSYALKLIEDYNQLYKTSFTAESKYRLFPGSDGEYEFKDRSWPLNHHAGVYIILTEDDEVIYVGQSGSFGYRFYQYFKDNNGNCVVRSANWSKQPFAIVAIGVPNDKKYERLSLEGYLIEKLQPIDNKVGK